MFVTDHATGVIYGLDLDGNVLGELDTGRGFGALGGIELGIRISIGKNLNPRPVCGVGELRGDKEPVLGEVVPYDDIVEVLPDWGNLNTLDGHVLRVHENNFGGSSHPFAGKDDDILKEAAFKFGLHGLTNPEGLMAGFQTVGVFDAGDHKKFEGRGVQCALGADNFTLP